MIYSRWRPDKGGYDYYRTGERRGMGDDLPHPRFPVTFGGIGVASVDCGRQPEGNMRPAGSGSEARGMLLPVSRSGLSGMPLLDTIGPWLGVAVAFTVGWFLGRRAE